jgi:hypothetical protein
MVTTRRAVLFTAAMLSVSSAYGTLRFHSAKFSPQCDHLPGVCVYGDKEPDSATLRLQKGDGNGLIRTLETCFSGHCSSVSASYENTEAMTPKRIGLGQLEDQSCEGGRNFQLKVSPRDTLVARRCFGQLTMPRDYENMMVRLRDIGNPHDPERYLAPYMGLKEIFIKPKPLSLTCPEPKLLESPRLCAEGPGSQKLIQDEELACGMEKRLGELAQSESGFMRCMLNQAREDLVKAIAEGFPAAGRLKDETERANLTIGDVHKSADQDIKTFWRGWDALFLLALAGAFAYGVKKLYDDTAKAIRKRFGRS